MIGSDWLAMRTLGRLLGNRTKTSERNPGRYPAAPRTYTYRVIESYPHSTDSYTQGAPVRRQSDVGKVRANTDTPACSASTSKQDART